MILEQLLTLSEAEFWAYCHLCRRDGLARSEGLATFQAHNASCGQPCTGGEHAAGRPVHGGLDCSQCRRAS